MVVFGDEKSDNGNTYALYHIPVSPPYWHGRFSNGPVWAEYLAHLFGLIPDPVINPGYNHNGFFLDYAEMDAVVLPESESSMFYPYGGPIKNGIRNFKIITLRQEVTRYLQYSESYRPNAMVIFWVGMHDLESTQCLQAAIPCMEKVINEIQYNILRLHQYGVTHFVVITVADRSKLPAIQNFFSKKNLSTYSGVVDAYNDQYYKMKRSLERQYSDVRIHIFDFKSFKNPLYHSLKNPSDRYCYHGTPYVYDSTSCKDVSNYYWWDEYDPTTEAYRYTAIGIYNDLFNDSSWGLVHKSLWGKFRDFFHF